MDSSLRIIICLLKIPTTNATRVSPLDFFFLFYICLMCPNPRLFNMHLNLPQQSLLDPFSKLLSFVIQYGIFSLSYLVELCGLCYKAFNKVLT